MAIEVGSKVTGKVTGITNFGVFVDLGDNQTGLVHISEVADHYVKDINDELDMGQTITVKVLSVGNDGKIGLSIRKAEDKPVEAAPKGNRSERNDRSNQRRDDRGSNRKSGSSDRRSNNKQGNDFDSLMSSFLKDSEDRLSSLKRNTENKRGGRGGRRG